MHSILFVPCTYVATYIAILYLANSVDMRKLSIEKKEKREET